MDATGATLDCRRSPTREAEAAERFFRQGLQASPTLPPRVLTVDQNAADPPAFEALEQERRLPEPWLLRHGKYLNTIRAQEHRLVKRRVNPAVGWGALATAQRTIQGYEARHRLRTGQIEGMATGDVLAQNCLINQLFGWAASRELTTLFSHSHKFLQHNQRQAAPFSKGTRAAEPKPPGCKPGAGPFRCRETRRPRRSLPCR